jgi:penicillin-binding protein-related factor A (putative recombinase)
MPLSMTLCVVRPMKYKNIYSAIHNFGDSFTSCINYHANGYVIQDLAEIHDKQIDIEINWLTREYRRKSM